MKKDQKLLDGNKELCVGAHKTGVEWRRSTRELYHERDWMEAGKEYVDFCSPEDDIYTVFQSKRWQQDIWVVDGHLRSGSNCMIAGESNIGKTYLALELAVSIVTGGRFLNHFECDKGPVIYVGGEGDKDMLIRRLNNIVRGKGIDPKEFFERYKTSLILSLPPNYVRSYPTPLANPEYQKAMYDLIIRQRPEHRPRAFIWDPLTALVPDVDKDPNTIQQVINWMKLMNKECDAISVFLHHPKKSQPNSPTDRRNRIRGESSWINFADDVIYVDGDSDDANIVNFWGNKSRDGIALGDSVPLFSAKKKFSNDSDLYADPFFADASPGALLKARFSYYYSTRREEPTPIQGKKGGKKKEEEDNVVKIDPVKIMVPKIYEILKTNVPLQQKQIKSLLGCKDDSIVVPALVQLINSGRVVSVRDGLNVYYTTPQILQKAQGQTWV